MPSSQHKGFALTASLLALLVAACSPAGNGSASRTSDVTAADVIGTGWTLIGDASRLSFVSVKAAEVAEVHHFERLSGSVKPDGSAVLEIPLEAVRTGVEIRDQRMKDLLFETARYPTAKLETQIDIAQMSALTVGAQIRSPISGTLTLHGMSAPVSTEVTVTRVSEDRVVVASLDPLVVNAASFGLLPGLGELQKLAKLSSITPDVPVSFQLTFGRDG